MTLHVIGSMLYANNGIYTYKRNYMVAKSEFFKALADITRLRVLNLFLISDESLCVCELMDALKIPQYAVSKALQVLRNVGLLSVQKKGTWAYYELDRSIPENKILFAFLKSYLNDEIFKEDTMRLNNRLLLRENNKCVVGIIPEKDLMKLIKEKTKEK